MSSYLTVFKENTQILKDLAIVQNTLSSYDIMTTSGNISLTTDNTFFNTYDNYSLDGSQLPLFNLGKPIQETNVIQKKNLSLFNNNRNGNIKIKLNLSGSYGVTNLTFNNPKTELLFIDNQWNVLNGPPLYVDTQQGSKLVGTGNSGNSLQGKAISLSADGNTLAIGAEDDGEPNPTRHGATWIFTRSGTTWTQQGTKLIGTGASGNVKQGNCVSLSADGNTLAIGAGQDGSNKGAVWIFTRSGTTWTQQGNKLLGTGASNPAEQGSAVSLSADGNTLAIGGLRDNSYRGATWIFTRSGTTWTQQGSKLLGSGFAGSESWQGVEVSLSADGNTLAVGASKDNSSAGATWIFTRTGTTWTQQGNKLVGAGAVNPADQGISVSLSADGNTLAIGGEGDNSTAGAVWIFTRSGTTWTQQGDKIVGTGASGTARQGYSVSLSADGNTLVSGGYIDSSNKGASWIFTRENTIWTQQGSKLVGTGATGNARQGSSVSLSANGNTLAVSGREDNSNLGATWIFT